MREYKKEYRAWYHAKQRCIDKSQPKTYARYGGRGIKMCERWLNNFENFLNDMGFAPSPKHSLERINNYGNYSPWNCKWATQSEQQHNKRNSRKATYKGKTLTLMEWARKYKVSYKTLYVHVYWWKEPFSEALKFLLDRKKKFAKF